MAVRTVDPKSVIIAIGGVPVSGFSDGTFLEISSDAQQFNKVTGADGFTTRVKTNNYGGTLTLTLAQSSPSNDVLSALFIADRLRNAGVVPVLIKDLTGTTIIFAASGWIQQIPDVSYGNTVLDRAWIIDLAEMDAFIGGNGETDQ